MTKVRPLNDRVLVKRMAEEEKTAGGLFIPDAAKEKPAKGVVIAVGQGKSDDTGKRTPLDVKAGDRILFVAHDPHTGICCAGRESSDEAQYDAQGMRAAWWLGYAAAMEVIKARAAQCDMDFYGYSMEEAERAFAAAGLPGDRP